MPTHWYNIAADLPTPAPAVLHPSTLQPVGPDDLAPLFPMELILQEVSTEREVPIPEPVREIFRLWRPSPLYRAHRLGEGARHAGEDLLQVRRRLAGRLAQAEHRGAAGLVQPAGRHPQDRHRDRCRPVGLVAGVRRRAVRHPGDGVPGARVVRPEAVPARADGDLWRTLHRLAVERDELRARDPRAEPRTSRLARHRDLGGGRGRRDERRHQVRARLGAQPRADAPDHHRPGGDAAARDGGRRSRRGRRLHPAAAPTSPASASRSSASSCAARARPSSAASSRSSRQPARR